MGTEQSAFFSMAAMMTDQGVLFFVESQADMTMPALHWVATVTTKKQICIAPPI